MPDSDDVHMGVDRASAESRVFRECDVVSLHATPPDRPTPTRGMVDRTTAALSTRLDDPRSRQHRRAAASLVDEAALVTVLP
ncbi:hypothetical protein [Streptomyces echinatus]|uniref:hypothetical protein n=1 Tax=Streptomyces echinatus TaxID=67293 RepID=UPI0031EC4F3E